MSQVTLLFDDFWSWRMKQSPEFSTMTGCKEYNDVLETFTEERFEEDFKSCNVFVKRAKELLEISTDPNDSLNLEFFIAEVSTYTDGYHLKGFYFPINYMEGVHIDFQRLPEWATPGCVKDYEDLLARYRAFPSYADQIVETMRAGVKNQMTNHAVSMKGVVDQCKEHGLAVVEDTVFYKPFLDADIIVKTEKERLQNDAKDAIKKCVQVGFMKIAEFLAGEYLAACRPQIAATSLPGGPEFYKACLKFHTSTDLTAEEIHQKGVQEVARIEREMKDIIKELGIDMSLTDFMESLRNDKENFFSSAEEVLEAFSTIIHDRINPNLTKIFHSCPKAKLEITEAPIPDYPAAFYIAGTEDGARPGKLFVNTFKYASQPRYDMVTLALHETNPGHHLQASYTLEKEGMPQFRKVMEDRVYSQAPSRFPINTAYMEGWALYTETLGDDLGLYDDPMDKYGHLSAEIFRACRLVVDTGMHAMGWSMEQAVEYMMEHSAASKENIVGEVNRYVTWPGQAVGYKIGQMKIIELRRRAEQVLGDKFDIKQFHDVVLSAAGPLNILERQVDQFIKSSC
eukprot:GFUD01028002.1.p1 GENE.GFUD01028002.1~~GFUD01028002.1.p1  ORF type:complete len:569 (-),score=195.27 GFUD01028002.1:15-1721(-)